MTMSYLLASIIALTVGMGGLLVHLFGDLSFGAFLVRCLAGVIGGFIGIWSALLLDRWITRRIREARQEAPTPRPTPRPAERKE